MQSKQSTHVDPRVTRTREKVLDVVRSILDRDGPMAVSYSTVAKASGVGRQTLYNHWANPEEMIRDAAIEGYVGGFPTEAESAEDAIRQWLHGVSAAMAERRRMAGISSMIALAPHTPESETALREWAASRVAAFNDLVAPLGLTCSAATYARIVGPVQFQIVLARAPVTDALIDAIATSMAGELEPA